MELYLLLMECGCGHSRMGETSEEGRADSLLVG